MIALPVSAPQANRRSALRRQPALGTVCRLAFGPNQRDHLGLVWNLSSCGISMFLDEPPEMGIVLSAELATIDEKAALKVAIRVVHARAIRTGDYFLGAQFQRPLGSDEMLPFLAEPYPEA